MRIIAGMHGGRKLFTAKGLWLRPTTDRVKTYIFDKIGKRINNSNVLDLFAGSGGLGIEALSREAKYVAFVDKSKIACEIIKKNLGLINNPGNTKILTRDALSYVQNKKLKRQFDLIFIDPPYDYELTGSVLQNIRKQNILSPGGTIIFEQRTTKNMPEYNYFEIIDKKSFGNTTIQWLQISGENK
jgi:16S rRNA (guanine966-N2)-methyltransferase